MVTLEVMKRELRVEMVTLEVMKGLKRNVKLKPLMDLALVMVALTTS
jgi:hypothetical protein